MDEEHGFIYFCGDKLRTKAQCWAAIIAAILVIGGYLAGSSTATPKMYGPDPASRQAAAIERLATVFESVERDVRAGRQR